LAISLKLADAIASVIQIRQGLSNNCCPFHHIDGPFECRAQIRIGSKGADKRAAGAKNCWTDFTNTAEAGIEERLLLELIRSPGLRFGLVRKLSLVG
jgi:hypothetical protein